MDCDRAFLSLIDNRNQFIIAEMTKHQSLAGPDPTQPLLLGVAQIALEWGVCPYTMSIFSGKPVDIPETPYIVADPSYFYIEDFRQIPSFATRPYVAGYPSMVSYVEVPLRSLSGHLLGSYCVVDNKSRDFLKPEALATIREVTSAISSYLNMKRVDAGRTRSERVVDGLRQFIGSERQNPHMRLGAAEASKLVTNPFELDVFGRVSQNGPISRLDQSPSSDRFEEVSGNGKMPVEWLTSALVPDYSGSVCCSSQVNDCICLGVQYTLYVDVPKYRRRSTCQTRSKNVFSASPTNQYPEAGFARPS
jgi:hypothetical protein